MKKMMLMALSFSLFSYAVQAQDINELKQKTNIIKLPKTFIKANIISPVIKNYGFQLEQVLSKRVSIAVGYRTMPKGNLPFKSAIVNQSGGNASTQQALDALFMKNTAFTPELRFYLGKKGYGRGFYVAPFYRNAKYNVEGLSFDYTNSTNTQSTMYLSGELNTSTMGIQLGAQWSLGKHVCLDWWIIGPHYGNANGTLKGTTSVALSTNEQTSLRNELNNFSVPLATVKPTVDANGATVNITGPWAGIKAGLMLGIKL